MTVLVWFDLLERDMWRNNTNLGGVEMTTVFVDVRIFVHVPSVSGIFPLFVGNSVYFNPLFLSQTVPASSSSRSSATSTSATWTQMRVSPDCGNTPLTGELYVVVILSEQLTIEGAE